MLRRRGRGARLKEEVWQWSTGEVVKYSLAYINPTICGTDNGRVLGYDNGHGYHHRHYMGQQEDVIFLGYEQLANRFYEEVRAIWRLEDETEGKR